jgi:hypothetical protein
MFDLTSSHFDSYCLSLTHNHEWSPPVFPLCHCTHAPAYHCVPLVSSEHSNDKEEESGALNGTGPNNIYDFVLEDDVSIVMKSKMKWRIWKRMAKYCYFLLSRKSYKFGSTLCGLQFPLTKISCQSPNLYCTCRCIHNVVQD